MSVAYLSTILSSHFLVGFFPGRRLFLMIFECCADNAMFLLYLSVYDIICNPHYCTRYLHQQRHLKTATA
jgi:hypothetical protein